MLNELELQIAFQLDPKECYKKFIETNFRIVDKENREIDFRLNPIQEKYLIDDITDRDIILKARQQGFSSLILAKFTVDFILKQNSQNVVVADIDDNAEILLERVKKYLRSYTEMTGNKINLKYNSKTQLYNASNGATYTIGTAKNAEFGRSRTLTNLHLSEFAFYGHPDKILAGALQAVTESGYAVIETTANGFNYFKELWNECIEGRSTFKPLFYKASDFYSQEFLEKKKLELGNLYVQEYPENSLEAFIASGEQYFSSEALADYLSYTENYESKKIPTS